MPTQTRTPATRTAYTDAALWSDINEVQASDDVYATCEYLDFQHPSGLLWEDYGFNIPAGATVTGITFYMEQWCATDQTVFVHTCVKGGTSGLFGSVTGTTTETVLEINESIGDGVDPLWGLGPWTPDEINNDLKCAIYFDDMLDAGGAVSIDHVYAVVTYTGGSAGTTRQLKVRL